MGNQGVVQRVQHSLIFKALFQSKVEAMEACPINGKRIRDFCSAKHRFDSCQKPFGRMVLMFPALVATAEAIRRGRHGKTDAKDANAWLDELSPEMAIQAAMMADGGDEVLVLLRFFDEEGFAGRVH